MAKARKGFSKWSKKMYNYKTVCLKRLLKNIFSMKGIVKNNSHNTSYFPFKAMKKCWRNFAKRFKVGNILAKCVCKAQSN